MGTKLRELCRKFTDVGKSVLVRGFMLEDGSVWAEEIQFR
jgi:hypothetical protein